ncbi:sensor histidine kinase [Actinacidiphila oryziradicis]|uniref:histidine kinase n=1 Tax=Actinacidiphila oryziradicis TaxID=2571141 RepID=A0A4U0SJL4_9ACTN|nr:HAMP domain-containing sensor histidine kinase [Actinacidiphila oryziradicis]TKA09148.1 HAMP domain-containing histidine kinase [Actinacidiphila oryziradicis]
MSGRHWTLRTRLTVSTTALLAVVCAVIALITALAMRSFLRQSLDDRLDAVADRSAGTVTRTVGKSAELSYLSAFGVPGGTVGVAVDGGSVTTAEMVSATGEAEQPTAAQQAVLAAVRADGGHYTVRLPGLGVYRVKAVRAGSADGAVVTTGVPLAAVDSIVTRLVVVELVVAAGGLALAGLASAVVVGRNLRPLRQISATALRISGRPLHSGEVSALERVPASDADANTEVGRVAAALNRLLGHVEGALEARHASEQRMRRFLADASHELRTPLAAITGYAQLTRRGTEVVGPQTALALAQVEAGAARLSSLVDDLLLLARLDDNRPLERGEVDLSPLVAEAVRDVHTAAPDHHWRLEVPNEPVLVTGDQARLHQVVANLLANARTHTPAGTTVTAAVRPQEDGILVQVTDDGPGISPELLSRVFERFARGDASRSRAAGGTGLGLAVVSSVVAAHNGRVEAASEPGRTVFTLRLPWGAPSPERIAEAVESY